MVENRNHDRILTFVKIPGVGEMSNRFFVRDLKTVVKLLTNCWSHCNRIVEH